MRPIAFLLSVPIFLTACQKNNEPVIFDIEKSTLLATYTINPNMSVAQINTVIASANAGDTVWAEAGKYEIDSQLVFKPGVALCRKTAVKPVFDATGTGSELFVMSYGTNLNDCLIKGIVFYNIRFLIQGAVNMKFWYCEFDYGKRKPGTDKAYLSDAYLQFNNTDNSVVDSCRFFRRAGNSGRGVYSFNTKNMKIINNQFGNDGSLGYFVTAINGNTQANGNMQIQANTIRRNSAWVNDAETDHGIYMHSFDGVLIKYNKISGWPTNASGGCIKVRNCSNITIFGNDLANSGILMYEYDLPAFPYFKYADVAYNTISIPYDERDINDLYHGIGYSRNNANGTEYSIRIANNTMPNGTIKIDGANLNVSAINAEGGGVFNNDAGLLLIKDGINQSGNF